MKSAYIDYSMSVIVSRALPDVREDVYKRQPAPKAGALTGLRYTPFCNFFYF